MTSGKYDNRDSYCYSRGNRTIRASRTQQFAVSQFADGIFFTNRIQSDHLFTLFVPLGVNFKANLTDSELSCPVRAIHAYCRMTNRTASAGRTCNVLIQRRTVRYPARNRCGMTTTLTQKANCTQM